jgi:hypothetical protein
MHMKIPTLLKLLKLSWKDSFFTTQFYRNLTIFIFSVLISPASSQIFIWGLFISNSYTRKRYVITCLSRPSVGGMWFYVWCKNLWNILWLINLMPKHKILCLSIFRYIYIVKYLRHIMKWRRAFVNHNEHYNTICVLVCFYLAL